MVLDLDESQENLGRALGQRIPEGWQIVAVLPGSQPWRFKVFAQSMLKPLLGDDG